MLSKRNNVSISCTYKLWEANTSPISLKYSEKVEIVLSTGRD